MTAMSSTSKSQTSIAKFEEFFSTSYKDDVFEVLEKYPDERSLKVDYNALEIFDPDLADLLIDKPGEVIQAAQIAINNIDPLVKDAKINIHFENLTNIIPFNNIGSIYTGTFISVDGRIAAIEEPAPRIETGVFECTGCMRLHEVEQTSATSIIEPSLCSECGGRSFRLLQEESRYIDTQNLTLKYFNEENKTSRELVIVVEDDIVSYDDYHIGQPLRVTGTFRVFREEVSKKFKGYLYVNHIEFLDYPIEDEWEEQSQKEYGARNTPEYNAWRQKVINRDKGICQCCGSEKHPRVHHIHSYEKYPDLRVDITNGITLCKWCHGKYHSHYGIRDANPIDLMDFFNRFGRSSTVIINESNSSENDIEEEIITIPSYELDNNRKYSSFLNIINSLSDDKGYCSYTDIISRLKSKFDINTIESMIKTVKNRGLIYEPSEGYVVITSPEYLKM